ncbi:transposase [Streptomyces sp. NPDC015501]|uniref:transposase n=1 Tax=unclassified Streptomyces TaxID=2593676 RepID=UPI0036FBBFCC
MGRQYTGTSRKIDNCQIEVFAAYATSRRRALVDRELYLPKAWTQDRERCQAAKIPDERQFARKGELAKVMVT